MPGIGGLSPRTVIAPQHSAPAAHFTSEAVRQGSAGVTADDTSGTGIGSVNSGSTASLPSQSTTAPTTAAITTGNSAATGSVLPTSLTTQQTQAIENAVSGAINWLQQQGKGGATQGTLNARILAALTSSGLFTQDELTAISGGIGQEAGGNSGFKETDVGGGNTGAMVASWVANANAGLTNYFQNNTAQNAVTAATNPADATTDTSASDLSTLAGLLQDVGSTAGTTDDSQPAQEVQTTGTDSSNVIIGIVVMLVAAGLFYWWWKTKHHAGAAAHHEE